MMFISSMGEIIFCQRNLYLVIYLDLGIVLTSVHGILDKSDDFCLENFPLWEWF